MTKVIELAADTNVQEASNDETSFNAAPYLLVYVLKSSQLAFPCRLTRFRMQLTNETCTFE
eukprot:1158306-Pelagomonas_calceolata.AAC.8